MPSWELDRLNAERLADLLHHWGRAYAISRYPDRWEATFLDTADPALTAASADELRILIRADYDQRTVGG